jgi:hydroxymethylglutaryl-CoA reductase
VRSGPAGIVSQLTCAVAMPEQPVTVVSSTAQPENAERAIRLMGVLARGETTPAADHCFPASSSSLECAGAGRDGAGGTGVVR